MQRSIIIEPYSPIQASRRQRARYRLESILIAVGAVALFGTIFMTCNSYRETADRAVDVWARKVG